MVVDLHAVKGQLSSTQIQNLMTQLLAGASYMHELNVCHRELMSAIVQLRVHEGQSMAAIVDLGAPLSDEFSIPHSLYTYLEAAHIVQSRFVAGILFLPFCLLFLEPSCTGVAPRNRALSSTFQNFKGTKRFADVWAFASGSARSDAGNTSIEQLKRTESIYQSPQPCHDGLSASHEASRAAPAFYNVRLSAAFCCNFH